MLRNREDNKYNSLSESDDSSIDSDEFSSSSCSSYSGSDETLSDEEYDEEHRSFLRSMNVYDKYRKDNRFMFNLSRIEHARHRRALLSKPPWEHENPEYDEKINIDFYK